MKDTWTEHKRIIFDGDGYSDEWHAEAECRGLPNLRTTPDALPALIDPGVEAIFEKFHVLSARELESRYEVMAVQYTTKVNIEGETAENIARTMLLPAAVRHLALLKAAGVDELIAETEGLSRSSSRRSALSRRPTRGTRSPTRWKRPTTSRTPCCRPWRRSARSPTALSTSSPTTLAAAEVLGDTVRQVSGSDSRHATPFPPTLL